MCRVLVDARSNLRDASHPMRGARWGAIISRRVPIDDQIKIAFPPGGLCAPDRRSTAGATTRRRAATAGGARVGRACTCQPLVYMLMMTVWQDTLPFDDCNE